MNRNTIGLIVAGLITGAGLGFIAVRDPATILNSARTVQSGKARVGGPFTLTDQHGKRVSDKDFLGRYMLIFFGFTNCPDICPSGLQVMSAALDKLGARAANVTPIFITFDPVEDTPEKLGQYVKSFSPRLIGLTGSEQEIAAAAKAYRVFYQKVADQTDPSRYSYDHSAIFYLMGPNGELVAPIPHTTDVDQLADAIDKALPQRDS